MQPKVSVIIPTYNRPKLIQRATKGVLNQTYQNFEVVIIDDSQDNETEKVVHDVLNDKRIRYIKNKIKRGPSAARNQGIKESSIDSKYIALLDDDDEYLPTFLEKTVQRLEGKKDLIGVTSYIDFRTTEGLRLGIERKPVKEFWRTRIGNGWVLRKKLFEKENIWFDERQEFDELDFGIQVAKDHKIDCIPEALRIYYGYSVGKKPSFVSLDGAAESKLFLKKYYSLYSCLGRKALGFFYSTIGRAFCQSGEIKQGRKNLLKAFLVYPRPDYFLFYLVSLLFPGLFQNSFLRILKRRIFQGKI